MDNNKNEEEQFINFIGQLADEHKGTPKITRQKLCFYCNGKNCIKSHSISENVLNEIASPKNYLFKFNDKWFYFKLAVSRVKGRQHFINMDNNESILNDIPSSDASVFDGFCSECDANLFKSLDGGISKGKTRFKWELLYRTIAYKIRYLEEEVNMETRILDFAEKNDFFCHLWQSNFENTEAEIFYSSKQAIKDKINTMKEIIDYLNSEMVKVKSYENNDILFKKTYCWKEVPLSKESLNFLGINYIPFLYEGENLKIKLNSDLLIAQFGYKALSWTKENPKYHYSQIIVCKKESEYLLENIINNLGCTEFINNILIDNEKMHSNTFFKRFSDKSDIINSKNEK